MWFFPIHLHRNTIGHIPIQVGHKSVSHQIKIVAFSRHLTEFCYKNRFQQSIQLNSNKYSIGLLTMLILLVNGIPATNSTRRNNNKKLDLRWKSDSDWIKTSIYMLKYLMLVWFDSPQLEDQNTRCKLMHVYWTPMRQAW